MEMSLEQAKTRVAGLELAIADALSHEVAEAAVRAVQHAAENNVYSAYSPRIASMASLRRKEHGGLIDPHNIITHVENGNTLVVDNVTGLQNRFYSENNMNRDTSLLTPIIEKGNSEYYQPFPRPFMDYAKELLIDGGDADLAMRKGLARQGYDTSGLTFTFV